MTISIRLDKELERQLTEYAQSKGVSKSTVVRESLATYLATERITPSAWEAGKDLFGKAGSGRKDLGSNHRKHLKEKIRERKRPR